MSMWFEDFVVVMNKTREDMELNRAMLNNITERTLKSIDDAHQVRTLQQQVHQLERIDRRTSDIIDDLEHGQLTELILPRSTLSSLVDISLPLELYYHWCMTTPLWNDRWVFETWLPVVSEKPIIS